jgi:hypothetical protein
MTEELNEKTQVNSGEKSKRKTHTSTAVKARYNQKTYDNYHVTVRKESALNEAIKAYKEENPQGFSKLMLSLLNKHFGLEDN